MNQWLYRFTPGPRPELARGEGWTEADELVAAAHGEYLREAAEDGTVIMAGRSQDGVGPAMVVFAAADEADARAFMEGDPFVSSGLFGAELHPYRVAFWSNPAE
ncbi:MAG: hypothetical protein HKN01_11015 [Acidimicrobiia bacterium]|nr:hypothetical protein [Acidimicrobiia bacterium]NNF70292.1 hypothetical protein [Acidimicrobiia bacterium]